MDEGAQAARRRTATGVVALLATVLLWSSFALSTRALGETSLTTLDAAFLRFLTPVVLLAPWLPRTLRALRAESVRSVALVLVAGLPHFLLFAWGADLTSAGLTGLLVPGTVPLFVTLLDVARGRPLARAKVLPLALVVAGIAASACLVGPGAGLGGIAVLLSAGLAWAVYTVGLQGTRLDLVGVVLVVGVTSSVASLLLGVGGVMHSALLTGGVRLPDLATFVVVQGVGTGVLSTFCYVTAVTSLGARVTAFGGALSPVLTAVVAVPLLGEPLPAGLAVALGLVVVGVVATAYRRTSRCGAQVGVPAGRRPAPSARTLAASASSAANRSP